MIVHEIEPRSDKWCVVAKGRRMREDRVVAEFVGEAQAREAMQKLNAAQMGRGAAESIGPEHVKAGCVCARGVALPGDPPCPVHS